MSTKSDKYRADREDSTRNSNYASALKGSNDFVYSFLPRFGYTTDLKDALRDVGIYYGENGISIPIEFTNELFLAGVKVGKRKAIINKSEGKEILNCDNTDNVNLEQLIEERINYTKYFINQHDDKFTANENDLITIGQYYRDHGLDLPLSFDHPLILSGYYNINKESHRSR